MKRFLFIKDYTKLKSLVLGPQQGVVQYPITEEDYLELKQELDQGFSTYVMIGYISGSNNIYAKVKSVHRYPRIPFSGNLQYVMTVSILSDVIVETYLPPFGLQEGIDFDDGYEE